MARVGILGGTFDPPHVAHIVMARTALERIPLAKVLFMPAPAPPHKDVDALTPFGLRAEMVKLAVEGEEGMELSLLERFGEGPSYTVELLERYKAQHDDDDVYLILGADSVCDLPNWKNPELILGLATLVIFPRTGYSSVVPVKGDASVVLFEEPVVDVSSSEIRGRYRTGGSARDLLPGRIHNFILDNSLYS